MLKFIEGSELIKEFRDLKEERARVDLAIAFWGKDSSSKLQIEKGNRTRIICNLESGACNPNEIEKLQTLADIRTLSDLHAKVYITPRGVIIGSSNASTNGLAVSAKDAPGWREANIVTDDPDIQLAVGKWFQRMWKVAKPIEDELLQAARELWYKRRKIAPTRGKAKSLLEALRADAEDLESANIDCIVWREGLDKGAQSRADDITADMRAPERAMFYQPVKPLEAGHWLIRCDFDRKQPKINGYAHVLDDEVLSWPSEVKGEPDLYAAFEKEKIKIGQRSYTLSAAEKVELLSKLASDPRVESAWKTGDAVIPLRDLIR
jgi:hypothetical protein